MSAWQPVGYHSVVREGTTFSLPVKVLVPVDRDSWQLPDDEYDAMRHRCAAFVAGALNRSGGVEEVVVPRVLVDELIAAIGDLRGCDGNPFLTAANARAQRLALTLAGLLEAKP